MIRTPLRSARKDYAALIHTLREASEIDYMRGIAFEYLMPCRRCVLTPHHFPRTPHRLDTIDDIIATKPGLGASAALNRDAVSRLRRATAACTISNAPQHIGRLVSLPTA